MSHLLEYNMLIETEMDNYLNAVETSLKCENWHAALFVALAIPDICGALEYPEISSKVRYINWYNKYLLSKYSSHIGANHTPHIFLSGLDCYAFRCSLLHEGTGDIERNRTRTVLERIHFNEPSADGGSMHCNQMNRVLQLQVDVFCKDIIGATRQWLLDVKNDGNIQAQMASLLKIYPPFNFPGFIGSPKKP